LARAASSNDIQIIITNKYQATIDTAMLQIPQVFPSAIQPNPSSPH
jgi:hypothetical protein